MLRFFSVFIIMIFLSGCYVQHAGYYPRQNIGSSAGVFVGSGGEGASLLGRLPLLYHPGVIQRTPLYFDYYRGYIYNDRALRRPHYYKRIPIVKRRHFLRKKMPVRQHRRFYHQNRQPYRLYQGLRW